MAGNIININDSDFENEILKSDIPCLVDFWAPWCGPCKMIAPILDELSVEFAGKVKIAKVNVDDNPKTATAYKIRSIPCLILVKNGEKVGELIGFRDRTEIAAALNELTI